MLHALRGGGGILFILALAAPAARAEPGLPAPGTAVFHGPRTSHYVALTFDGCFGQTASYDEGVIQALRAAKAPATLFLSGQWMRDRPDVIQDLAADPLFELGVHGQRHRNLTTTEKFEAEMSQQVKSFESLLGRKPFWFRPPFAVHDDRVLQRSQELGLVVVEYDVASGDPDASLSAQRLLQRTLASIRPGSIVVFHMNGKGHHTAEILPKLIAELRKRGMEPATLSTLFRAHPSATPAQAPPQAPIANRRKPATLEK